MLGYSKVALAWLFVALSHSQLTPDEDLACSSYYEPTDCLRDNDCFWCGNENPGFGKSQCFSKTKSNTTCEDMKCSEKFCDQNPYILNEKNFYYTEGECIVHNRNCSYNEFDGFVYGWCTNRWRGGGWNCECISKRDYKDQCETTYYETWDGKCLGIIVPGWIVWILFFLVTLPEIFVDTTRLSMLVRPVTYIAKVFLFLVPVFRFVWLGLFTKSCMSNEAIGDFTGGAFYSMSTVLAVVVTLLFPAIWFNLVAQLQDMPTGTIEQTLAKIFSFFFGAVYFLIGLITTILQATSYDKFRDHGPLFFDNLNSGIAACLFFIAWIWLMISAVLERSAFNSNEKGKSLRYKNTALLISGVLLLLALIVLFIYMAVGARRDAWSYLGFHAVLEVGLAIFVFILWVVIQDYLWNGGFCGGYFAAFSGKTRYIEDLYYSMDDGVDSYAVY